MKTKKITKGKLTLQNARFYEEDGVQYPSVTTIISPEGIPFPLHLLVQYGSRGTIVHTKIEHYLTTGQWPENLDLHEQEDLDNVINGSLNLKIDDCNPEGFFEEYGHLIEARYIERRLINKKYGYAGRADILGKYDKEWAVLDTKTAGKYTQEKLIKIWKQLSAYANCVYPPLKKMVILPINPKSPNGYDAPIICYDVEHFFSLFKKDIEHFNKTYKLPTPMETKPATVEVTQVIQPEPLKIPNFSNALLKANEQVGKFQLPEEITTMKQFTAAQDLCGKIKKVHDQIEKYRDTKKRPFYSIYKELQDSFNIPMKKLKAMEKKLKDTMMVFHDEEQIRMDAVQAKIDATAKKAIEDGEEVIVPVMNDLKTVTTAKTKATVKETKKFRIVDETKIPREFLMPNEKAIKEAMKIQKPIPGVEYYIDKSFAVSK